MPNCLNILQVYKLPNKIERHVEMENRLTTVRREGALGDGEKKLKGLSKKQNKMKQTKQNS